MSADRTGQVGPEFTEPAFRTNVVPDRSWISGRPTVVLFHSRENQDEARGIIQSIRNVHDSAETVVTVNLVDLGMFPRVMRKLVNFDLNNVFEYEVSNLWDNRDPESHVIIVPDYDGKMTKSWEVSDAATVVSGVVLDTEWRIFLRVSGPEVERRVLRALGELVGAAGA